MKPSPHEHGTQPLHALMEKHSLAPLELIEVADAPLTFKQIRKARQGRALTLRLQKRILEATQKTLQSRGINAPLELSELFSYRGR